MKVLTLTQPWASLVALGAKRIETRSWSANYRGPLAIHAAKSMPKDARAFAMFNPWCAQVLFDNDLTVGTLPRGVILATCRLVTVGYTDHISIGTSLTPGESRIYQHGIRISGQEFAFGDYSPNRFAWFLEDVCPLSEPIPAKGALGLWEFAGLAGRVRS
jgi:hypothetical protein